MILENNDSKKSKGLETELLPSKWEIKQRTTLKTKKQAILIGYLIKETILSFLVFFIKKNINEST